VQENPPLPEHEDTSPSQRVPCLGAGNSHIFSLFPKSSGENSLRACLIAITIAGERRRRSPVLVYCVENVQSAFSTQYTKLFARRSRASIWERGRSLEESDRF